ncbi:hypothetical protein PFISCL1PPCAC_3688, partial [Pristionchus fissidentatus]
KRRDLRLDRTFAMSGKIYVMGDNYGSWRMYAIDAANYALTRVRVHCHDFDATDLHVNFSSIVVYGDKAYTWNSSSKQLCFGMFEAGELHWRIATTTGTPPAHHIVLIDHHFNGVAPPICRALNYIEDRLHLFELDLGSFEWTQKPTEMDEVLKRKWIDEQGGKGAIVVVGRQMHLYTVPEFTNMVLDLDTCMWSELPKVGDRTYTPHDLFRANGRLFANVYNDHLNMIEYSGEERLWRKVYRTNFHPQRASKSYKYHVTIGSRVFFIGSLHEFPFDDPEYNKMQLSVLETTVFWSAMKVKTPTSVIYLSRQIAKIRPTTTTTTGTAGRIFSAGGAMMKKITEKRKERRK